MQNIPLGDKVAKSEIEQMKLLNVSNFYVDILWKTFLVDKYFLVG